MSDNPHYMSPEEMSKVICPVNRGVGMPSREVIVNDAPIGKPCVAYHCAAWRWASWYEKELDEHIWSDEFGYCGMIGP